MEGTVESQDALTARGVAGDLDRVLHGLGAAVEEGGHFLEITGREFDEFFRQFHVPLVHDYVETAVDVVFGLGLDGLDDLGVAVADIHDANPADEVDVFAALHVRDGGP